VVQGALTDRQPHRHEFLLVATQPEVPASEVFLTIDGDDGAFLGQPGGGPPFYERVAGSALITAGDVGDGQDPADPGRVSGTPRDARP
jgi:hypothetical protein